MINFENIDRKAVVLLAEDNPADQKLTIIALKKGKVNTDLKIVNDGQEAIEYLKNLGAFENKEENPRPDLILLDINMPRMDGKTVLKEIRRDPKLSTIPVIMLTTSDQERDVLESYKLGVNAYINKPVQVKEFFDIIQKLKDFWFRLTLLPPNTK